MKHRLIAVLCALASAAVAQMNDYAGPGVLSRGAGDIGTRSGQQVDLRYYISVTGVYDTGLLPFSVDSTGHLLNVSGLYGEEADVGVYGTHSWKRAILGIDYVGSYRHYSQNSGYDGSDHRFALGYTFRPAKRIALDIRQLAGTDSRAFGSTAYNVPTDIVNQPTSLLFDNRTYYVQSTMDVNFIQTARTIYTFGGDGFAVRRQSSALVGLNGYDLHGSVQHRLSKSTTIGGSYQFQHFDYPRAFGQADLHTAEAVYSTALNRRWTLSIHGGATHAEVRGQQSVAVDPVITALTGQVAVLQTFYRVNTLPSGGATLSGRFKTSSLSFNYSRGTGAGNGLYLTSRQESATASYSYSGIRKASLSVSGGYSSLSGLAQGLSSYGQYNVSAGASYNLSHALHLTARYEARQTDLDTYLYHRLGYRVSVGLTFSPGSLPVSFW